MNIALLCTKKPSKAVDFAFSFSAGGGWGGVNVIQKPAVETKMQGTFISRSMDTRPKVNNALAMTIDHAEHRNDNEALEWLGRNSTGD